jgi:hypothetical protein
MPKTVELELYLHHETMDGILLSSTGEEDEAVWLPKKFVEQGERTSRTKPIYEYTLPTWLAEKEGLV